MTVKTVSTQWTVELINVNRTRVINSATYPQNCSINIVKLIKINIKIKIK